MKERYCICEEIIGGQLSGCFTIRVESDCIPGRFRIIGSYETFEHANQVYYFLTE